MGPLVLYIRLSDFSTRPQALFSTSSTWEIKSKSNQILSSFFFWTIVKGLKQGESRLDFKLYLGWRKTCGTRWNLMKLAPSINLSSSTLFSCSRWFGSFHINGFKLGDCGVHWNALRIICKAWFSFVRWFFSHLKG